MAIIRNALVPSRCSIGTRSRNAMSSSIVMRSASRHQFVAAGFRYQDFGGGRVLFDLLPQPGDVRLPCVRGDAGIVAPYFLEQGLARNRPLPNAVKIAQDRGFLLRQADFVAFWIKQELGTRPERIRTDREYRVFARLMLAQLGANARQQYRKTKRLGDVVVGSRFQAENGVGIGIMPGKHDDRRLKTVLAQDAHRLASVDVGQ